jgi:hypothetical protein
VLCTDEEAVQAITLTENCRGSHALLQNFMDWGGLHHIEVGNHLPLVDFAFPAHLILQSSFLRHS